MFDDTYRTLAAPAEGLYKEKGSKFLAFAYPVRTPDDVKAHLDELRKQYFDARHHCYAYRLGLKGDKFRANDDGEPSGSAGRPILGQIDSLGLSDILVVVVRYFGGIKLGIPGLIRAYKTSTSDALQSATTIEKIAGKIFRIEFSYEAMNPVMKALKDLSLPQSKQSFGMECSLETRVRLSSEDDFKKRLQDIKGCTFSEI